jgi:F420-non-reducing hydrogenase iron-sulfur subunit
MSSEGNFKPQLVGIICNWCCYGGADLAGVSRFQYPPYMNIVRVMCSGRVDMKHLFRAFLNGADGVFVGGCHLGDCHYITEGNYDALNMVQLSKKILELIGVNPQRLRIEWVSAGEGIRYANIMNEFLKQVEGFGPLGKGEGLDENELKVKLENIYKLIPYIKVTAKEKLKVRKIDNDEDHNTLFTLDEVDNLLSEVVSYYIDPAKCQACMTCARRCPAGAIISAKGQVHIIEQDKCIKCGTCFEVCPPKFAAVTKLAAGVPVPPPVPEGERAVVRKTKEKTEGVMA